jgi:hypothetical protein
MAIHSTRSCQVQPCGTVLSTDTHGVTAHSGRQCIPGGVTAAVQLSRNQLQPAGTSSSRSMTLGGDTLIAQPPSGPAPHGPTSCPEHEPHVCMSSTLTREGTEACLEQRQVTSHCTRHTSCWEHTACPARGLSFVRHTHPHQHISAHIPKQGTASSVVLVTTAARSHCTNRLPHCSSTHLAGQQNNGLAQQPGCWPCHAQAQARLLARREALTGPLQETTCATCSCILVTLHGGRGCQGPWPAIDTAAS